MKFQAILKGFFKGLIGFFSLFVLFSSSHLQAKTLSSLKKESVFSLNAKTSTALEETEYGRELLKYITSCALKEGTSLTFAHDGVTYTFPGSMGLAPEWLDGPLSETGQRWVTACLLARTNHFGTRVELSMRGDHPTLKTIPVQEEQNFPLQEAAFYGNLFKDPQHQYVCKGKMENPRGPWVEKRVCSDSIEGSPLTKCGFVFTGDCNGIHPGTQEPTCVKKAGPNGYYSECQSNSGIYSEVITTYLKNE